VVAAVVVAAAVVVVTASVTVSGKIDLAYYGIVQYQLTNMRAAGRNAQP
jgi:hypothetical protein